MDTKEKLFFTCYPFVSAQTNQEIGWFVLGEGQLWLGAWLETIKHKIGTEFPGAQFVEMASPVSSADGFKGQFSKLRMI